MLSTINLRRMAKRLAANLPFIGRLRDMALGSRYKAESHMLRAEIEKWKIEWLSIDAARAALQLQLTSSTAKVESLIRQSLGATRNAELWRDAVNRRNPALAEALDAHSKTRKALAEAEETARRLQERLDETSPSLAALEAEIEMERQHARSQADEAAAWQRSLLEHLTMKAKPEALSGRLALSPQPLPQRIQRAASLDSPRPKAIVSFVLGTYNRLELLKLAIDSIRTQKTDQAFEIIVIDGGSGDGTIAWLAEQTDIVTIVQHNRIAQEGFQRRRSWGYFMNLGFRTAEGRWICMVSDDCILHPDATDQAIRRAAELDRTGRPIGGLAFAFRNWPKDVHYFIQHTIGGMLMVNHGFFLRDALLDVDFADEDFYDFYKADSDLALKLWASGYEIEASPRSLVEHLLLPSEELRMANNKSMEADRQRLMQRWDGVFSSLAYGDLFKPPRQSFIDTPVDPTIARRFQPFVARETGAAS